MKKTKSQTSSAQGSVVKEASPPTATPSEAQRMAAVILEVLAGVQSPPTAAELLKVSLARYYQLEARALAGLLAALAPRPRGKQPSLEKRLRQLEKELEAARRACARQEALVRLTQRTLGLAALTKAKPAVAGPKGKSRKPRRPMVRALKAAQTLREQADTNVGNAESPSLQPTAPAGEAEEIRP
jgi:hypothetical protein